VEIEGELYIDGGVVNNLPVEPLIGQCDTIVGMNCNPIDLSFSGNNMKDYVERTFMLAIDSNTRASQQYCDISIEPGTIAKYKALDFNKVDELFKKGYNFARKHWKNISSKL